MARRVAFCLEVASTKQKRTNDVGIRVLQAQGNDTSTCVDPDGIRLHHGAIANDRGKWDEADHSRPGEV